MNAPRLVDLLLETSYAEALSWIRLMGTALRDRFANAQRNDEANEADAYNAVLAKWPREVNDEALKAADERLELVLVHDPVTLKHECRTWLNVLQRHLKRMRSPDLPEWRVREATDEVKALYNLFYRAGTDNADLRALHAEIQNHEDPPTDDRVERWIEAVRTATNPAALDRLDKQTGRDEASFWAKRHAEHFIAYLEGLKKKSEERWELFQRKLGRS